MEITDDCLKMMCERMKFKFFSADETVFNYGDSGNLFYVILQGSVSVIVPE